MGVFYNNMWMAYVYKIVGTVAIDMVRNRIEGPQCIKSPHLKEDNSTEHGQVFESDLVLLFIHIYFSRYPPECNALPASQLKPADGVYRILKGSL